MTKRDSSERSEELRETKVVMVVVMVGNASCLKVMLRNWLYWVHTTLLVRDLLLSRSVI